MSSLQQLFGAYGPWLWAGLGVVLLTLEVLVPGVHFLWFGLAAVAVTAAAALLPIGLGWQIVLFGLISMVTVYVGRRLAREQTGPTDAPALNERGQQYVGRTVVVEDAIADGRGRVRVDDTLWAAEGPNIPAGSAAKVTGVKNTVLVVERA